MRCQLFASSAYAVLLSSALISAAPFSFPLPNGFPTPSNAFLLAIEQEAGGTLSDQPPPPSISADGITNLKLIAFNELFKVAFFTELLLNITTHVEGYEIDQDKRLTTDSISAIIAQEELHALTANNGLAHFKVEPIEPCTYIFPVDSFDATIALAATFTDVVLGTLQEVITIFADNNDNGLVAGIAAVIGQEGEQEGFYRLLQQKKASSAPFLTASARDFAFTAIQSFTVPGSCPSLGDIPLKTFGALTLLSTPEPVDSQLTFQIPAGSLSGSWNNTSGYSGKYGNNTTSYSLVYITGQNLPVVKPLISVTPGTGGLTITADFPFQSEIFNHGLTIAAVVHGSGPFADAQAVADSTLFGPAFFEVL